MVNIHIRLDVRSFAWKTTFPIHPDVILTVRLVNSTPRADAIFLFISDILWLSMSSQSPPSSLLTTNSDTSIGGVVYVGILK